MTRRVGGELTAELVERLSQRDLAAMLGRAIPVITVDPDGRPHPMLCSYLELLAVDARTVRIAIGAGSGSAVNMQERRVVTVLLVERGIATYLKCRASGDGRVFGELVRFELCVDDVLEDSAAETEGDARITGGISYEPVPGMERDWVRETMRVLREE